MNDNCELDTLELTTVAYFAHGADMPAMTHCSARFRNTQIDNFIPARWPLKIWRVGFGAITRYGSYQLAQFMIANGLREFNRGFVDACYDDNIELAQLMINHGANDFNKGLKIACRSDHLELAKLMISKGADDFYANLINVCINHQIELARLLIASGADRNILHRYPQLRDDVFRAT